MAEILIVDDDAHICEALRQFLTQLGHRPLIASNAQDALKYVAASHPALVLMDIRMPGTDGLDALGRMRAIDPQVCVVIMTGYGTSQTSIEAMRLGAYDYLTKPLDLEVIKGVIDQALEAQALSQEVRQTPAAEWEYYSLVNLVGQSAPMQEVYKRIGLLTTNDLPVLIIGEPGVGKQTVAKTIHFNSHRKTQPFVAVDCQALPEAVLEREVFGQETSDTGLGTTVVARGKVETAHGGTLFLAHIGAMSLPVQTRLCRLLAENTFERVHGSSSVRSDTRIMAAHETDLKAAVRLGHFHAELYDHLGVVPLHVPPLRQRREDITTLVTHFVQCCNVELHKTLKGVEQRVLQRCMDYAWPANVRELHHVIRRACVLARGDVITSAEFGDTLHDYVLPARDTVDTTLEASVRHALQQRLDDTPAWAAPFHDIVGQVERILVRAALETTAGNQVKAAELLGLNRTTLRQKIRLYDL